MIAGSPDEIADRVRAYRSAGVTHLALDFVETYADALVASIQRFDREVIAAL